MHDHCHQALNPEAAGTTNTRIWARKSARDGPLGEQEEVDAETMIWAWLWHAAQQPHVPDDLLEDVEQLSPLTSEDLRQAAWSFPAGTGRGIDNISPRAFARLSDGLLSSLGSWLSVAERLGTWPAMCRCIMVILFPKPDGGRRPIGLFHSLVRLWGRARSDYARRWEQQTDMPCVFGSSGKGAQRAAWQVAFRSEVAAQHRKSYGHTLFDLVNCFEQLQ